RAAARRGRSRPWRGCSLECPAFSCSKELNHRGTEAQRRERQSRTEESGLETPTIPLTSISSLVFSSLCLCASVVQLLSRYFRDLAGAAALAGLRGGRGVAPPSRSRSSTLAAWALRPSFFASSTTSSAISRRPLRVKLMMLVRRRKSLALSPLVK